MSSDPEIRDPVCGMTVDPSGPHHHQHAGRTYHFCSERCLSRFREEPDRFDPSRFDRENTAARLPYTYIPFGGGRRNCIGSAFARAEARIVLSRILQRFHLEPVPHHVRPYMGATLEPHPGVWMVQHLRGSSARMPRDVSEVAA